MRVTFGPSEDPLRATKGRSPSVNEGPLSGEEEPFTDSERTALEYSVNGRSEIPRQVPLPTPSDLSPERIFIEHAILNDEPDGLDASFRGYALNHFGLPHILASRAILEGSLRRALLRSIDITL